MRLMLLLLFIPILALAQSSKRTQPQAVPEYTYKVVGEFPHDPSAFIQGLVYYNGFFYEGTGRHGESQLRKVKMSTGEVLQRVDLPLEYFGEGITIFNNEVIQITWQSQTGFVYDLRDFHLLRQFSYPGEGWGLTTHGNEIFMSDGTPEIRVLDGNTLQEKRDRKSTRLNSSQANISY